MRKDIPRYFRMGGVALLLALLLISGCTRSKSAGPPTATAGGTSAPPATQPPDSESSPTPGLSGQDALAATRTALAEEAAVTPPSSQPTQAPPSDTPEATAPPEATEPAATEPAATEVPEPSPTLEPTEAPAPTEPPASGEIRIHTVQLNETLFGIARIYGVDPDELAAFNGIVNSDKIDVGQEIKIPPGGEVVAPPVQNPGFHIVQQDENLYRIALKYGMLFTTLARANGLTYPYDIYVGQKLIIP
jgi:LysM repeat protein